MFKLNKNNDLDIKLEFNLEQHKKKHQNETVVY